MGGIHRQRCLSLEPGLRLCAYQRPRKFDATL